MQETILDDYQLEMENRIRNLLWTVSGDYTLEMKPNVETFLRSKSLALYDGIKQGAFAKYYDKDHWECIWSRKFSYRVWKLL